MANLISLIQMFLKNWIIISHEYEKGVLECQSKANFLCNKYLFNTYILSCDKFVLGRCKMKGLWKLIANLFSLFYHIGEMTFTEQEVSVVFVDV